MNLNARLGNLEKRLSPRVVRVNAHHQLMAVAFDDPTIGTMMEKAAERRYPIGTGTQAGNVDENELMEQIETRLAEIGTAIGLEGAAL